jgi:hypothetical protein
MIGRLLYRDGQASRIHVQPPEGDESRVSVHFYEFDGGRNMESTCSVSTTPKHDYLPPINKRDVRAGRFHVDLRSCANMPMSASEMIRPI